MNERNSLLVNLIARDQERFLRGNRLRRLRASVLGSAEELANDRARRDSVATRWPHVRLWPSLLASGLAGACLAILGVALWPAGSLRYRVAGQEEGATPLGTWIEANHDSGTPIWFSDGTVLGLQPGTRMKVERVAPHGADVLIAEGSVHVAVVHLPKTDWTLRVGPFEVSVTGTRFEVGWQPNVGEFALEMEEGSVVVSGGCLAQQRTLSRGEAIRTRCPVPLKETIAPAPLGSAAVSTGASSVEPAGVHSLEPTPAGSSTASRGITMVPVQLPTATSATSTRSSGPATESAQTWLEAATAARLAGDAAGARAALMQLRTRFVRSPQAVLAAFDLGVLASDMGQDVRDAVQWFETYLREAPSGSLRREALGRLIEAHQQTADVNGLRSAASRYAREFPDGPQAALARELSR